MPQCILERLLGDAVEPDLHRRRQRNDGRRRLESRAGLFRQGGESRRQRPPLQRSGAEVEDERRASSSPLRVRSSAAVTLRRTRSGSLC